MNSCTTNPILWVALVLVVMAIVFIQKSNSEDFHIKQHHNRGAAPYYTTSFQAYPGKYMQFGSNRNHECLQRNTSFSGYRNCMLYLQ